MPLFNKTVVVPSTAVTTNQVLSAELPVNPLTYLDLTLLVKQSVLHTIVDPPDILADLSLVEVLLRGDPIISMSLQDLAAYSYATLGEWPDLVNHGNAAGQAIRATFRIPFGRRRFWAQECLPPFRRGDLILRLTAGSAFTDQSEVKVQVEATEILDATPVRYIKATTFSKTPTATGDNDADLPIGNRITKVVLFSTTVPSGTSEVTTVDKVAVLVDNVRLFYPETEWEAIHADFLAKGHAGLPRIHDHQHMYDPTLAAANQTTDRAQGEAFTLRQYGLLDFDPLTDPEMGYALLTAGRSRVHLRVTAGDTQQFRYIPAEVIELAPRAGGGT